MLARSSTDIWQEVRRRRILYALIKERQRHQGTEPETAWIIGVYSKPSDEFDFKASSVSYYEWIGLKVSDIETTTSHVLSLLDMIIGVRHNDYTRRVYSELYVVR